MVTARLRYGNFCGLYTAHCCVNCHRCTTMMTAKVYHIRTTRRALHCLYLSLKIGALRRYRSINDKKAFPNSGRVDFTSKESKRRERTKKVNTKNTALLIRMHVLLKFVLFSQRLYAVDSFPASWGSLNPQKSRTQSIYVLSTIKEAACGVCAERGQKSRYKTIRLFQQEKTHTSYKNTAHDKIYRAPRIN